MVRERTVRGGIVDGPAVKQRGTSALPGATPLGRALFQLLNPEVTMSADSTLGVSSRVSQF
jgi:hypothetical protein